MPSAHHQYEQVECGPFRGHVSELMIGPIHIVRDRVDNPVAYRGGTWHGFPIFISMLDSPGRIDFRGSTVDPNTVVRLPAGYVHRTCCNGPVENVAVSVDEEALLEFAENATDCDVTRQSLQGTLYVTDPRIAARFQRISIAVLAEATDEPSIVENSKWRASAGKAVMQELIDVVLARTTSLRRLPPPSTRRYIVDKAIEFMEANLADPIAVSSVAEAARVCPRTLRYSFESVLGVSPAHYLLRLRLHRARRDLIADDSGTGIHRIAQRYGFVHMGRFAKYYRVAFGERPSDTCR